MDSTSVFNPVRVGYQSSNFNDARLCPSWITELLSRTEMKDCKLAIVGILGDSNSGKSFLLNILAEYLRCEEEGINGWMENLSNKKSLTGFALHKELKRDSFNEGIYMWPRPFVLKKPCDDDKKENVVVLLLDINMDGISIEMEVLMCLLCSTLIYFKNAERPDISRILSVRNAILGLDSSSFNETYNLHPKNVIFQHMMVVFRDFSPSQKFKCGKNKLAYLSEVMQMEEKVLWEEEFDKIPNKNCFLLKKPDPPVFGPQGQLHLEDKDFVKQLKTLAEDLLTIDDLPLKSVENSLITLNELNKIERMVCLIPKIVSNFQNPPYMKTNLHELHVPMDMSIFDREANVAVIINDNDLYDEVTSQTEASKDIEMEDLTQNQNTSEGCSQLQYQYSSPALSHRKLSEKECERMEKEEFNSKHNQNDHPFAADRNANCSKVNEECVEYLSTVRKNYANKMEKFFSTTEKSEGNLKEIHDSFLENTLAEVDRCWKEKIDPADDIKEKIHLVLQNDFLSYWDRFVKNSKIQETGDRLVKIIENDFTHDCDNFIKSGAFIKKQTSEVIEELWKKSSLKMQLSSTDAQQVTQLIMPHLEKCKNRLETLKNIFLQFTNESKKNFQMFKFLTEDQLDKLRDNADKIAERSKLNEVDTGIFQRGLQAILKECKHVNEEIIKNEIATLKEIVHSRIKNFYDDEMKKFTQNRKSVTQLKTAHQKLKMECFEAVKRSCSYNDFHYNRLQSSFDELDKVLNKSLDFHSDNNQRKIDKVIAKVKLLLAKSRRDYIELMSKNIGNHILCPQQLEQFHEDVYNETCANLKFELQYLNEDPEPHMKSLEALIKANFGSFREDNLNRMEAAKREKLKLEAMEKKLEKERVEDSRLNNNRKFNAEPEKSKTQTYEFQKNQSDTKTSKIDRSTGSIAVEFGMKTVKCGKVMDDGQFTIIPDRWGKTNFPNVVGVTSDDKILIGESNVHPYGEMKYYNNNLTDILCAPSEKLSPLPLIDFKGVKRQITKELLCGLILSRVKSDAENFLKVSVDSVTITVPLCYTSSQRQATKDAAKIAGFSLIHLINEPTAAALAYANYDMRAKSKNNFLVIVANTDSFLDMAVYEYNSGKVEMASCAGDLHHASTGIVQSTLNWVKNLFGEERRRFISSLIKECVGKREIKEYALICDNETTYSEIQKIANPICREALKPDRSTAILMGAAIFAKLRNADEERAISFVSDKLPYQIEFARGNNKSRLCLCDRHENLPLTERKFSHHIESYDDLKYQIYESGNEQNFVTGFLCVPYDIGKRNLQFNFVLNADGILRVTANYTDTDPKQEIEINYNSFNMSEEQVALNASLVCSLVENPKLENERRILENAKTELRNLAQFILTNLEQVQSVYGKDQMEKRASAALEAIAHPKITKQDIDNKAAVLTKLKTRYLS